MANKIKPLPVFIIERGGRYWNGTDFVKDPSRAVVFPSIELAWTYVDMRFYAYIAEEISLEIQSEANKKKKSL